MARWRMVLFLIIMVFALVALILSFFEPPPDVPEFVWGPRVF